MNPISNIRSLHGYRKYLILLLLAGMSFMAHAQTDSLPADPGALVIYNVQNLSFGVFTHNGSGGTVAISSAGTRSVTGPITALNMGVPYFQAMFDLETYQGAIISVLNGPDAVLTGSNGGSMTMHLGASSPASPFIITTASPARTPVSFGGTLTVGNAAANPPGTYSGTFYIIFNQE